MGSTPTFPALDRYDTIDSMSATQITLSFTATVQDYDYWPEVHRHEIADKAISPDEYVRDMLYDAMHNAGQEFINNNPELFRVDTLD